MREKKASERSLDAERKPGGGLAERNALRRDPERRKIDGRGRAASHEMASGSFLALWVEGALRRLRCPVKYDDAGDLPCPLTCLDKVQVLSRTMRAGPHCRRTGKTRRRRIEMRSEPETTHRQYTHGVPDQTMVSPDGQNLDNFYLARPGADEVRRRSPP